MELSADLAAGVPELAFGLALAALVAAIAVIDLRRLVIPDALNLGLALAGLLYLGIVRGGALLPALAGAAAAMGLLWSVREGFRRTRGVVGLGLGDVKMAGAAALWVSPWNLPLLLLLACLAALGFVFAAGGGRPDRGMRVPFGPFIGAGLLLTWLLERSNLPTLAP